MKVDLIPTQNEWDAPISLWRMADGTTTLRRDLEEPTDSWWRSTLILHGIVKLDDVTSEFDLNRPAGALHHLVVGHEYRSFWLFGVRNNEAAIIHRQQFPTCEWRPT